MLYPPLGLNALYLDFDSFFASAEQHLRPELRGKPVGVTPLPGEFTALIAASREAKAIGIKMGTPVREARALCPHIMIVAARPEHYVRLHHAILNSIGRIVPIEAVRSIDELVCHLLNNEQARARELALDIKAALAHDIGPTLTCSIGVGPNELIAKIGAEMRKPDGLVIIKPDDLPGALYPLALLDVPGIGTGNAARLMKAGVHDVRALLALAPKQMRALWGNVEGERMHAALHGLTVERPPPRRGMFGHSRVLPPNWCGPAQVAGCARLLLVKAARRMRREGFAAQRLYLGLRMRDYERWTGEERFAPLQDDHGILAALDVLLVKAYRQHGLRRVKSVAVTLCHVMPAGDICADLFATEATEAARARREKLTQVTDALALRFGDAAATLGVQLQPPGGYAGAKIAFGRIPDMADFDAVRS
jgi:DNA polymerase IV